MVENISGQSGKMLNSSRVILLVILSHHQIFFLVVVVVVAYDLSKVNNERMSMEIRIIKLCQQP